MAFATHAVLPSEIKGLTQPTIVLAHPERGDGLLTIGDIFGLSLDADFVTLSACDTGLPTADSTGNGISGFTRLDGRVPAADRESLERVVDVALGVVLIVRVQNHDFETNSLRVHRCAHCGQSVASGMLCGSFQVGERCALHAQDKRCTRQPFGGPARGGLARDAVTWVMFDGAQL